jgi:hypothetical protein
VEESRICIGSSSTPLSKRRKADVGFGTITKSKDRAPGSEDILT